MPTRPYRSHGRAVSFLSPPCDIGVGIDIECTHWRGVGGSVPQEAVELKVLTYNCLCLLREEGRGI